MTKIPTYLKNFLPEILANTSLPVSIQYTQYFTRYEHKISVENSDYSVAIVVETYQSVNYELLLTLGKNFSKPFEDLTVSNG
jgi:hypothetical protein